MEIPKPGMILMNSAALLPVCTKFCSSLVVNLLDFSPESTGANKSALAATYTVSVVAPTVRAMSTLRFSPPPREMPPIFAEVNPLASTVIS